MPAGQGDMWVQLLGSPADFEKFVLSALESQFDRAVDKAISLIKTNLKPLIHEAIENCDEMEDLRSGAFRGEIGLTSSQANGAVYEIAKAVSEAIEFKNTKSSIKKRTGGLEIYIQPSSFVNVLSIGDSSIKYYSKKYKREVELEWLDWMLTRGDAIIVGNFHFEPDVGRGRSRLGRMKKTGSWRITPSYAGTADDNFISRALSNKSMQKAISKIVKKAMEKNWD